MPHVLAAEERMLVVAGGIAGSSDDAATSAAVASAAVAAAAGLGGTGRGRRWSAAVSLVVASIVMIALPGCSCERAIVAFPDHPVIVQGAWEGVATSSLHLTIDLALVLEVAYVDTFGYDVRGILERAGAAPLEVRGAVAGFCEQRFEPAAVHRSTAPPEVPRLEATLFHASGARAGTILVYRLLDPGSDHDTMRGHLSLDDPDASRSYAFELARR
jgi:hypothetical protein